MNELNLSTSSELIKYEILHMYISSGLRNVLFSKCFSFVDFYSSLVKFSRTIISEYLSVAASYYERLCLQKLLKDVLSCLEDCP